MLQIVLINGETEIPRDLNCCFHCFNVVHYVNKVLTAQYVTTIQQEEQLYG